MSRLVRFFHEQGTENEHERGQSLVEFALLLPLMLLIITGLLDVARAVWQENTLAYAAREGTRWLIVHGSAGSPATDATDPNDPVVNQAKTIVRQAAIGVQNVTVTVQFPDFVGPTRCNDRNCRVIVDASAPFVPLPSQYLLGSAYQITLRGGSQLVIQR
ncbi:MAG TPA: TadE family protein [Candidatus Limnocylindria bacterium]|nr:TadE family protein [Candidatus Limnocylindria bacterium]